MRFDAIGDREIVTVGGDRFLIVTVKELPGWRALAIFDYESGRIAAEAESAESAESSETTAYRVTPPLDDHVIYEGQEVEPAIARVIELDPQIRTWLEQSRARFQE